MDYLQHAFYGASDWDPDNFYSYLNASAQSGLPAPEHTETEADIEKTC